MAAFPRQMPPAEITGEQLVTALALIKANPAIGNTRALRQAGVKGTKGQLHALITSDYEDDFNEARGCFVRKVENTIWGVAQDIEHQSWYRAAQMIMRAYGGPEWQDNARLEHTGSVEVSNTDVADALDRFTAAVSAAAVRHAARERAGDADGGPERGGAQAPALALARVAGSA